MIGPPPSSVFPTSIRAMRAAALRAGGGGPLGTRTSPPGGAARPPPVTVATTNPNVIEPEIMPMDEQLVAQAGDPKLSPLGRAAVGAAIGGVLTAAFEFPGGPVLGVLAGGTLGYFLPMGGKRG